MAFIIEAMKHKSKKQQKKLMHDELVYAYYKQLTINESLERTVAMYENLFNKIKDDVNKIEDAIDFVKHL